MTVNAGDGLSKKDVKDVKDVTSLNFSSCARVKDFREKLFLTSLTSLIIVFIGVSERTQSKNDCGLVVIALLQSLFPAEPS